MKLQLLSIAVAVLVTACNKQEKPSPIPTRMALSDSALSQELSEHRVKMFRLESRIDALENGAAQLSADEQTYSVAHTNLGAFPVVCQKVSPYLDGFRVNLGIGNITSGTLRGAKITVRWALFSLSGNSQEKEFPVTEIFPPGRYTNVSLILAPATADDIRLMYVFLEFNSLALR